MPVCAWVLLLRGINVGGKNILPMQALRALLESRGCEQVATYIQSGNAVFTSAGKREELEEHVANTIENEFGFRPAVLVIPASEFSAIAAANPYRDIEAGEKLVHISFLKKAAKDADHHRLQALRANGENFHLTDSAFYLHAPAGIGRSKLAASTEKCLGVETTSRNRRTVEKIEALLQKIEHSI